MISIHFIFCYESVVILKMTQHDTRLSTNWTSMTLHKICMYVRSIIGRKSNMWCRWIFSIFTCLITFMLSSFYFIKFFFILLSVWRLSEDILDKDFVQLWSALDEYDKKFSLTCRRCYSFTLWSNLFHLRYVNDFKSTE